MQLKAQSGMSIIETLVSVAIVAAIAVSVGGYITTYQTAVMSAKKSGALADLDGYLRRHSDCRKTVATNYVLCQSTTFKPLPRTFSSSCESFDTASPSLRTDLQTSYDIDAFGLACRKIGANMYEITANYQKHGDPTAVDLFLPNMQCEVKLMPAIKTFTSGWDARNFVVQNVQWLPWNDDVGDDSGSFFVQPDTIQGVCFVAGYRNYDGLPPSSRYHSCGDNSTFIWVPATMTFRYENSCAKNGQLWHGGAVNCKDPIGGEQPCP